MFCFVLLCLVLGHVLAVERPPPGLVGYDCRDRNASVATIDLTSTPVCGLEDTILQETVVPAQLVQKLDVTSQPFISCLVQYHEIVMHCGMHSHASIAPRGIRDRIHPLTRQQCSDLVTTGTFAPDMGPILRGIGQNELWQQSVDVFGTISQDGCEGSDFLDGATGIHYKDVTVSRAYQVLTRKSSGQFQHVRSALSLPTGESCVIDGPDDTCFTAGMGYVFLEGFEPDDCSDEKFEILYEGPVNIMTPSYPAGMENLPSSYAMVEADTPGDVSFALGLKKRRRKCGRLVIETEHRDIFLAQQQIGTYQFTQVGRGETQVDLPSYLNSKLSFFEQSIARNTEQLKKYLGAKLCEVHREQIHDILSLAHHRPDEFAYRICHNRPGCTAVTRGEAAHVFNCAPISAQLRETPGKCYINLPVRVDGRDLFLSPRTRVVTEIGGNTDCSDITPTLFKIGEDWVNPFSEGRRQITPQKFDFGVGKNGSWRYQRIGSFSDIGLWSDDDVRDHQQRYLFPEEIAAVSNGLGSTYTGNAPPQESGSPINLYSTKALEDMKDGIYKSVKGIFTTAGVVGGVWFLAWQLFGIGKNCVDVGVNCMTLRNIAGCGCHLILAFCMSCTHHYVLYRNRLNARTATPVHTRNTDGGAGGDLPCREDGRSKPGFWGYLRGKRPTPRPRTTTAPDVAMHHPPVEPPASAPPVSRMYPGVEDELSAPLNPPLMAQPRPTDPGHDQIFVQQWRA